jgi:hypothetical protein
MNPFKNLIVNLHAAGPAAVICVWLICTASIAVFGSGAIAESGMRLMFFAGGALMVVMGAVK